MNKIKEAAPVPIGAGAVFCIRIRNVSVPQRLYKVSSNSSK